jgi:hypothetical protein
METSRRNLLSVIASPAMAAGQRRFYAVYAQYMKAMVALNNTPDDISEADYERIEDAYGDAYDRLRDEPCVTDHDFVLKFSQLYADGAFPVTATRELMSREAARLAGEGR